jgi:hypothetical protein
MARKIAVDLLKKNQAKEVLVKLAYSIGVDEPVMATAIIDGKEEKISGYDLTPKGIINFLKLKEPKFALTACWDILATILIGINNMFFKIIHKDKKSSARTGIIKTDHGEIHTPIFMPVGTQATVKTLDQKDLIDIKAQIILGNTYHLHLRPGENLIDKQGVCTNL